MTNEKNCSFCGIEIYWNKYDHKFYEINSGIHHDKIACENTRNTIKTGQEEIIKTEQEVISEDKSYQTGYKILKRTDEQDIQHDRIFAERTKIVNEDRFANYNKLNISYLHCVKCNQITEQKQTTKNVLKCLVCNTIQLGVCQ